MAIVNKPNTFSGNTTISSSEINSNFDTLYNEFNGSISAANLADDAVTAAKLADNAVVTASITDASVTSAKLAMQAWQSWTPTLTNLSGGTITFAKYVQIGKTVHVRFKYTLAGAGISGVPRVTLPVAGSADYSVNDQMQFSGAARDASGFVWNLQHLVVSGAASIDLYYINTSANLASISSTAPFTWAGADTINFGLTYEAA
jgi:hypothetical protein